MVPTRSATSHPERSSELLDSLTRKLVPQELDEALQRAGLSVVPIAVCARARAHRASARLPRSQPLTPAFAQPTWLSALWSEVRFVASDLPLPLDTLLAAWDIVKLFGMEGLFIASAALMRLGTEALVSPATEARAARAAPPQTSRR